MQGTLPEEQAQQQDGASTWGSSAYPEVAWDAQGDPLDVEQQASVLLPQPDLEVTCQCESKPRGGASSLRQALVPHKQIGPLEWLFRCYCKRCRHFTSPPRASDIVGAPTLPSPELLQATPEAVLSLNGGAGGQPLQLNLGIDPVINCQEFVEMLEDFDQLPRRISRNDVYCLFKAVLASTGDKHDLPGGGGLVRPPEIRFPQFCDLLIRVALVAAVRESATQKAPTEFTLLRSSLSPRSRAASPMRTSRLTSCSPSPNGRATSSSKGSGSLLQSASMRRRETRPCSPTGLPHGTAKIQAVMAQEQAQLQAASAALKGLLDQLELTHSSLSPLRHKLNELARTSKQRVAGKGKKRWMHVAGIEQSTASGSLGAHLPCQRATWSVLSPEPAPQSLHESLHMLGNSGRLHMHPQWKTLKEPKLELELRQGERCWARVVLRNRGVHQLGLHVDTSEIPWMSASFHERTLAAGLPRFIDMQTCCDLDPGDYTGVLKVYTAPRQGPGMTFLNIVPCFCSVKKYERKVSED